MSGWTVSAAPKRAIEVLREEGIKSLWFKVLGETVFRRVVLIERLLDQPVAPVAASIPVSIDSLTGTEVEEYCRFRPESDPAEIRRRLAAGQWCFVARHEGRIVHAGWAAGGQVWIDYLSREMRLALDEVYQYESFTSPVFRGQNIAPMRVAWMARFFKDAGYRRLLAVIVPENRPAFRPGQKVGYRPIGVMGYVKVGPWRRDFCRVDRASLPPGVSPAEHRSRYWDRVGLRCAEDHYLDPFLGEMKRQAHLALVQRWGGTPVSGRLLKTDLFEEAVGPDALLTDLRSGAGQVIGIDVSPEIAGQAQQRDADGQADYLTADVRRLPFASATFALIVSTSTLDHFPDPSDLGRSLRELRRVLEPAGRLVITVDNRQNIFDPLLRLAARQRRLPYYIGQSYTADELRAELEAADLAVQDTTAILHNPRLVAVGAVSVVNSLGWAPLRALVQRLLRAAQGLEQTRWRYFTGSFVAANAVRGAPQPSEYRPESQPPSS